MYPEYGKSVQVGSFDLHIQSAIIELAVMSYRHSFFQERECFETLGNLRPYIGGGIFDLIYGL
jgi:hypothetical protein